MMRSCSRYDVNSGRRHDDWTILGSNANLLDIYAQQRLLRAARVTLNATAHAAALHGTRSVHSSTGVPPPP